MVIINILIFLVALSFLVTIHELGHFFFAKLFGVYCFDFSIGMGPAFFAKKGKETSFHLRAFPIGGFVSMAGEEYQNNLEKKLLLSSVLDNEEELKQTLKHILENKKSLEIKKEYNAFNVIGDEEVYIGDELFVEKLIGLLKDENNDNSELIKKLEHILNIDMGDDFPEVPFSRTINGIKAWKRAFVMGGGVLMNFIIAFILLIPYVIFSGIPTTEGTAVKITKNSILYKAGISSDSEIIKIVNGYYSDELHETVISKKEVVPTNQVEVIISLSPKYILEPLKEFLIELPKANIYQEIIVSVKDTPDIYVTRTIIDLVINGNDDDYTLEYDNKKSGEIGVSQKTRLPSFGETFSESGRIFGYVSTTIFRSLGEIFTTKEGVNNVGGVIAIYQSSSQIAAMGVLPYMFFIILLSVNLGIMNLLPIPGLDGSQLLILAFEGITRKKLKPNTKAIINGIGLVILLGLMILISVKDIIGLF
jgi:regulator of sigma E protease